MLLIPELLFLVGDEFLVVFLPIFERPREGASEGFWERDLVDLLVRVRCDLSLSLLLLASGGFNHIGGCLIVGETELGEMAPGLLCDLKHLSVADAYPEHRRVGILRVKNVFDVALELEIVVLSQVEALGLQVNCLFDDFLQVLLHLF